MNYKKISDEDLKGIGVIGLPDTPALSAADMQAKFEETARKVIIPRHNALVDALTREGAPVQSRQARALVRGDDGDLLVRYGDGEPEALIPAALAKKADRSRVYTKAETEKAISDRVVEIGSSDMTKAVYDADGDGRVNRADSAAELAGRAPEYFRQRPFFTAVSFPASDWSGEEAPYARTAEVSGITGRDAPLADVCLGGEKEADEAALARWEQVGRIYTGDGTVTAVCYREKPRTDFTVKLLVLRGGESGE